MFSRTVNSYMDCAKVGGSFTSDTVTNTVAVDGNKLIDSREIDNLIVNSYSDLISLSRISLVLISPDISSTVNGTFSVNRM